MIIIAIAGIVCGIGAILLTLATAGKTETITVEASGGAVSSRSLPEFNTLIFDKDRTTYFCDSFPGMRIVVDPDVTTPVVSGDEEAMKFIDFQLDEDQLTLQITAVQDREADSEKIRREFTVNTITPITVTVGSLPDEIESRINYPLIITGQHEGKDTIHILPKASLDLIDISIANIEVNGRNTGRYDNMTLHLEGNTVIGDLTVTEMRGRRGMILETDSISIIEKMKWIGNKNTSARLTLNQATVKQFEFETAEKSDIEIKSASNITASFAAQ